jgi:hypothetical protein
MYLETLYYPLSFDWLRSIISEIMSIFEDQKNIKNTYFHIAEVQKVLKSKSSMALLLHEYQCYYISSIYNIIEGFTWKLLIFRK